MTQSYQFFTYWWKALFEFIYARITRNDVIIFQRYFKGTVKSLAEIKSVKSDAAVLLIDPNSMPKISNALDYCNYKMFTVEDKIFY